MAFQTVTIPGTTPYTGELYTPTGTAKTGLVVIAYGTDGRKDPWTGMMRGYAEELATHGLFALIPDYFAPTNTKHGGGAADEQRDRVVIDLPGDGIGTEQGRLAGRTRDVDLG